jgi:putative glutathione S-transferase
MGDAVTRLRRTKMGMLIDGKWIDDDRHYRNPEGGAFVRPQSSFDAWITADGSSGFKAEPGRYHLFLAPTCPWAHRTQIFRRLKGLEDVISVTLSDLPRKRSWAYSQGIGRDLEPVDGVFELHQAYVSANPTYTGRVTVPTLWDKKTWTIVNNESSQIIRMLNTAFNEWGDAAVDLYPADLRPEIDRLNERIYATVNNGVYRCGFAKTQAAYEEAFVKLFDTLDNLETLLGERRYLCGDRITEADWRLYVTLVRFDAAYYGNFKCNRQHIYEYHNLSNYLRELYQWPGIAEITDIPGIKRGYYAIGDVNPTGIVPMGPGNLHLDGPHDRALISAKLVA